VYPAVQHPPSRQIDDLTAGKTPPAQPPSLREFIDRKMAEDKKEK
jgi:hypothetical protein